MDINKPISIQLRCRANGAVLDAGLVDSVISIQRGLRADRSTANAQDGFLATEFVKSEVASLYEEGGNFFLLRQDETVLGFALTTQIGSFTDQFGSAASGRLATAEPLDLDSFVYLYQVAIRRGEQQRGLGKVLVQHVQRHHTQPLLADVLSLPVPNLASRAFFDRLGFRKVGVLELDSYRDYGSLTSDVLVDNPRPL